jgi:hypothetical protein
MSAGILDKFDTDEVPDIRVFHGSLSRAAYVQTEMSSGLADFKFNQSCTTSIFRVGVTNVVRPNRDISSVQV